LVLKTPGSVPFGIHENVTRSSMMKKNGRSGGAFFTALAGRSGGAGDAGRCNKRGK
jgi:hypothetical protein